MASIRSGPLSSAATGHNSSNRGAMSQVGGGGGGGAVVVESTPSSSSSSSSASTVDSKIDRDQVIDSEYFRSYAWLGIHKEMLEDDVRTTAYRDAFLDNKHHFDGKVVLDVGCGTGILSMFAADAGAKTVYAVDASDIADHVPEILKKNGYSDVVKLIKGKIEEIELPEKVDVIISEWMGYFLVYESMLDSVIVARDKWLKPDGIMYPSHARIFLTPFRWEEFYDDNITYWKNVYGKDMSALIPLAKKLAFTEPYVDSIGAANELALHPLKIKEIDCYTVKPEDLHNWHCDFKFSSMIMADMCGYAAWFDVQFCGSSPSRTRDARDKLSVLSTSPSADETHWAQTLFFLDVPQPMQQDDMVAGRINVSINSKNRRMIDVHFKWDCTTADGTVSFERDYAIQ